MKRPPVCSNCGLAPYWIPGEAKVKKAVHEQHPNLNKVKKWKNDPATGVKKSASDSFIVANEKTLTALLSLNFLNDAI